MDRPPCWPDGARCPHNCAAQLYRRVIWNETPLYGPWSGWRMADNSSLARTGNGSHPVSWTTCSISCDGNRSTSHTMTLLPNGRTERAVLDQELSANKELKRLTHAYLARVRAVYPNLSPNVRRDITPMMKQLRDFAGPTIPGL
jgi:hypothetical protein